MSDVIRLQRAAAFLKQVDAAIDRSGPRLSLHPQRQHATPLFELWRGHSSDAAESLAMVGLALLDAFPENVFWDLDYLAVQLEREHRLGRGVLFRSRIVALFDLFGRRTSIRFSYAHDFLYGFDWAKWKRQQRSESSTGPLDSEFLIHLEARGHQLLQRIEEDDTTYRKSVRGYRNPFSFRREPDDEVRLFRELQARNCIPVQAWSTRREASARVDFRSLREVIAQELGIASNPNPPKTVLQ